MLQRCLTAALTCSLLLLVIGGCDNLTGTGRDLVEEEGVGPRVVTQHATGVDTTSFEKITGNQERILAGRVDDPLFGRITALGYADFEEVERPDALDDGNIDEAYLSLTNDYRYGDTVSTVTLRLHEMPSDWTFQGAPADTSLTAGEFVTEFSFSPTDSSVVVPLPEGWVDRNETTLTSANFNSDFHGFQFSGLEDTNTIIGFARDPEVLRSELHLVVDDDTARYPVSSTLTSLNRLTNPTPPADRLAFQDGVGPGMQFNIDFEDVKNLGLNRAVLEVTADTVTMEEHRPDDFARPLLQQLTLYGVQENGDQVPLSIGVLDDHGRYLFSGEIAGAPLRPFLQSVLFSEIMFDHFRIGPFVNPQQPGNNPGENTINATLLYSTPDNAAQAPLARLTVTPLN